MMGHSHALSGAATWLLAAPPIMLLLGEPVTTSVLLIGTAATGGAALLPDLDHGDATLAHILGPITQVIAHVTHIISGGHRKGTHSILGVAVFALLSEICILGGHLASVIAIAILIAFGAKGLALVHGNAFRQAFIGFSVAGAIVYMSGIMHFALPSLILVVTLGVMTHIAGDMLTKEGCPLAYPVIRKHFAMPFIQRTGNLVELLVFAPLFTVIAVAAALHDFGGPSPWGLVTQVDTSVTAFVVNPMLAIAITGVIAIFVVVMVARVFNKFPSAPRPKARAQRRRR